MDKDLEKILAELRNHPKVLAVYLFGSQARGEAKPLSDIDIAVILKEIDPETEGEIGSLYSERIDLVLFHRLPLYIQFEVLKEGKELFVADEEYLEQVRFRVIKDYLEQEWLYRRLEEDILK
ncbi:MAG: type VII toxin-antitoxin system MntA family adenylyltransferase antitoxin [bacterium]